MSLLDRLDASWTDVAVVVVSAVGVYLATILYTRLAGVRALAKMSSFDFAATVAIGSTVSSTALGSASLTTGALALAMLYGLQYAVAALRRRGVFGGAVDNEPLLLMADGELLEGNLAHARMSVEELWSQLRLHGVTRRGQVRAVVLETTGDVSVLTGAADVDPQLLAGVRRGPAGQGRR